MLGANIGMFVYHILPDYPGTQPAPVIGIAKSVVGDITDSSNQAKAFSLLFVGVQIGSSLGYVVALVLLSTKQAEFYPIDC